MDIPDEMDDVDLVLRHVSRLFPEQIVAWLPKEVVVQSWIFKQGEEQGEAKGFVKGKAEAVLEVLAARGLRVSKTSRERILGEADPATLDGWLKRVVTVKKAAEIFEEPAN